MQPPRDRNRTLTQRGRKYLELVAIHWADFSACDATKPGEGPIQKLCALVPCAKGTVTDWRKNVPDFRKMEQDAREASLGRVQLDRDHPPWMVQRFFEVLEETDDRMAACKAIGARWRDVKRAIDADVGFSQRLSDYEEEWKIRAEDSLRKEVAGGDRTAARAYLSAHDERYAPGRKGRPEKNPNAATSAAERAAEALGWLDELLEVQN